MYVFFLRYILNSSDSLSLLVQILYVKPENGHKNLHSYARVLNMEAPKRAFTGIYRYLFFFSSSCFFRPAAPTRPRPVQQQPQVLPVRRAGGPLLPADPPP